MSAASNSFRRNQLFDVLEQIEDVRRNELVNDILDAIQEHQNYQGGLGGLGGGFRNDFSNRRRGGNDVDQLIDLVLGSYGRQGADGWGNNRYDNDVVGEIFGNRGRYGLNNDLEDIVEQLCGNDRYGRDFGNRPHVLEYIVNQLVGGDRNSFRGSQGGNIQQLLHQLLRGRNQRGGYDQDQRLNDVALVIINRLIRNLDGDNSRHGRFELDILDYLLNNYNRGGRQVDLYQVIQRLFNGYDSNSRRRFGEHDIVREIFRLVNDDGNRSFYDDDQDIYRGRNSNILQILRQYFRNQENDEEGGYRDQRFRDFLGGFGGISSGFNSYGRSGDRFHRNDNVQEILRDLFEGQGNRRRNNGGRFGHNDIADLFEQFGQEGRRGNFFGGRNRRGYQDIFADLFEQDDLQRGFGRGYNSYAGGSLGNRGFFGGNRSNNRFNRFGRSRFDDYDAGNSGLFNSFNKQRRF